MRSEQPPKLARVLLEHFGCSPNNAAMVGDLDERYHQGHSRIWYWRQILITLMAGFIEDIWRHKLFALRAVTVGMIVLHRMANLFFPPFGRLIGGIVRATGHMPFWIYIAFAFAVCLTGVTSGWLTGRFHRAHEPAAMLLYALSVVLYLTGFALVSGINYSPLSLGGSPGFYVLNSTILVGSILLSEIHTSSIGRTV